MEFFLIYCLFAVTTSLTSLYELVSPVIRRAKEEGTIIHSTYLYYSTFFLINLLVAPLILLSCVIPTWSIEFQSVLYDNLFKDLKN
jgi:hypothetical protein